MTENRTDIARKNLADAMPIVFRRYIMTVLAGDFAVAMASHLAAVEQPLQADVCTCEQNHGVTVAVNNQNVCRVCRNPRR